MRRILKAKWSKNNMSIAFICLIVGFLLSMLIKSVSANNKITSTNSNRIEALSSQLTEKTENEQELLKQIDQYKKQATESNSEANKILQQKLKKFEIASGATAVTGDGIEVVLNDSQDSTLSADDALLHYQDLLMVVNELRTLGAEAISINDVRLISNSTIRCVGATIMIDATAYPPPYTIKVIGNADEMITGLKMKGGIYENLVIQGFQFDIKRKKKLELPMYKKPIEFKYTKEAKS